MSADRLRRGEFVVLAGLLVLFVSLFLKWFGLERVDSNSRGVTVSVFGSTSAGWGYLGPFWILLLVVAVVVGLAAVVLAARSGPGLPTFGAVAAVVVGVFVSGLILVLMLVRVLIARPTPSANDLGSDAIVSAQAVSGSLVDLARAEAHLSLAAGAWIGLLGLLLLTVGLWMAMSDDRTSAAESTTTPPAFSAIPPLKPPLPEPEITEAATDPDPAAPSGPDPAATSDPSPTSEPAPAAPSEPAPAPETTTEPPATPAPDPGPAADPAPPTAPGSGSAAPPEPDPLPARTFRPPGAADPGDDLPPAPPGRTDPS